MARASRLDHAQAAVKAFYRRVERGETPGFPRFRSRERWDTLQAQYGSGCKFTPSSGKSAALYWAGAGELKVRQHRPLPDGARITELQVKRVAGGREWYVCLGFEMSAPAPLPATGESAGIDVGITTFAALSTGEKVSGPRAYRRHEKRLARLQQELARCERGSNRRRGKRGELARSHARIGRVRRDRPGRERSASHPPARGAPAGSPGSSRPQALPARNAQSACTSRRLALSGIRPISHRKVLTVF